MNRVLHIALLIAGLALATPVAPAASAPRDAEASRLAASARRRLVTDGFDDRRAAIRELEVATLLAPGHADWELLLARTYMRSGYLGLARHRFDRVRGLAPDDAEARFGLGLVWRHDWLKYLEKESLDQSVEQFRAAARLSPKRADPSIMLVPLLLERGEAAAAATAAAAALAAEPQRADAILADACVAYRLGLLARADSGFSRAIPKLPRALRARFEDIRPVASARDTLVLRQLWPNEVAAFTRRFWRQQDPDLASRENEAQLEYWSRVTHAYLLYYDARRQAWDERGEIYVRYGAPARQVYNAVGTRLASPLAPGGNFPMNVLVWEYPEYGMSVELQDRTLTGFYFPQIAGGLIHTELVDPAPDPDSLARRPGLMGTGGGRGIFSRLPPGSRPVPVEGFIARFEGESGPRVLAGFETPGGPEDSLFATWVVRDSSGLEVLRETRPLSPSACDPTEVQVADFAADLSPGGYLVGLSVSGADRRRGVFRERIALEAPGEDLALSDLVVSCGVPDATLLDAATPAVRVEPNPAARVRRGDPLTAYFEIAHLRAGADGLARFEFEYVVRSIERDERVWVKRLLAPRPVPAPIRTTREEEQLGSRRRQFVRVPLQSMPAGRYRLEVRVRDLVSGRTGESSAVFVHVEPGRGAGDPGSGAPEGGPERRP